MPHSTSTYAQVVERALVVERFGARIRKEDAALRDSRKSVPPAASTVKGGSPGDSKRKSSDSVQSPNPNKKARSSFRGRQGGSDSVKTYPQCQRCKKHHLGECRARACFTCGEIGHLKRDCPKESVVAPKKSDSLIPS